MQSAAPATRIPRVPSCPGAINAVTMRLFAIVELPDDDELSVRLAREAYRASRHGPVALLVPAEDTARVDRALDPAVAEDPHVHGVHYASPGDEWLWMRASAQTLVVGSHPVVSRRAALLGARCLRTEAALEQLAELARRPRAATGAQETDVHRRAG